MSVDLIRPSARTAQNPNRHVSVGELEVRTALEAWGRDRWPDARVCHELVVGQGQARADVAFIGPKHFVIAEVKSDYDTLDRLIHQAGMFRLVAPELWIVSGPRFSQSIDLVRFLLPSVGIAKVVAVNPLASEYAPRQGERRIEVMHEAAPFAPHQRSMLNLLWVAELEREALRARTWQGKRGTHAVLAQSLMVLTDAERMEAVCRQLRGRDALWRADPPVLNAS